MGLGRCSARGGRLDDFRRAVKQPYLTGPLDWRSSRHGTGRPSVAQGIIDESLAIGAADGQWAGMEEARRVAGRTRVRSWPP